IEITSLAVAQADGSYIVAVGTRDADAAQYGGVYILDEKPAVPAWQNTNIGSYDIGAVRFSPNYPADRQLVAVLTNETDTFVTTRVGDAAWGVTLANARLNKDNAAVPAPVAATAADIAFPADYDTDENTLWVAIETGGDGGDVYRIDRIESPGSSTATDLNIGANYGLRNLDVTSLAVSGETAAAYLLAGAARSAQVYRSSNGGKDWTRGSKPPTGQSDTFVLLATDFSSSGLAYAATSGTESAFSITRDGGTWNQTGLIDTDIADIVDVAPSADTLFMVTFSGAAKHSVWRSLNGGVKWERAYSSALNNVDSIQRVMLSPRYGNGSQVVFLAGNGSGGPSIWKSKNNGQDFTRRISHDPATNDTFTVDVWAAVDDDTLFVGSFDGSNSLVYVTTNSGWSFSPGTVAGNNSLSSLALSPDYKKDNTLLAGSTAGWVYLSSDNGSTFAPLPPRATSAPLTGVITVAFDPEFAKNRTIYAASRTANKGIYRFVIDKSAQWESIDGTLPTGGMVYRIAASANGALYAANYKAGGGMERCLDPTYPLGPAFETVTRGLDEGATLTGLWSQGDRLWSIDNHNRKLMTFVDSLAHAVTPVMPSHKSTDIDTKNVSLEWQTLKGATNYRWQLDYDTDFSTVPTGFEGTTRASSARLPTLEAATTYYWRVRATEPVLSPWSAKWSFTTSLGSGAAVLELLSPKAGAAAVPTRPVFQWSAVEGAGSYELLVSASATFANPTIVKIGSFALPSTAWECNVSLNNDTTYYWKVRAVGSTASTGWSAVGAFTTNAAPQPPSAPAPTPTPPVREPPAPAVIAPPAPPSPPTPVQPAIPNWIIYVVGALLLTIILLLVIMLILVIEIRRF
ncbi:MAG: hypothetical protein Q8O05_00180, partial [Chloroflexota bacterium]|nr:hypothetical protein [Chloroflexota bacterium]